MGEERAVQENRRHRGYESAERSYTDRRYGHAAMQWYCRVRTEEIEQVLAKVPGGESGPKVLDVGCGTGLLLNELAQARPDLQLMGVDFSAKMLAEARTALEGRGVSVELVQGSAFALPFPANSFDAVLSTRFIHQYSDELKAQILAEIRRCLKPQGTALVEFYSFWPWLLRYPLTRGTSFEQHVLHCTSQRKLRKLLGTSFNVVPLMIPGVTRLAGVIGLRGVRLARGLLLRSGMQFLFDQYLAVFGKR